MRFIATFTISVLAVSGCDGCDQPPGPTPAATSSVTVAAPVDAAAADAAADATAEPEVMPEPICPPDMVKVTPPEPAPDAQPDAGADAETDTDADAGAKAKPLGPYCVDRYESMLVDADTRERISPYYNPTKKWARSAARVWESKRFEVGKVKAQLVPLPPLPAWQLQRNPKPLSQSRKAVVPNGHVNGAQALAACNAAGKRPCSWREWRTACGGEQQRKFPYGDEYIHGKCNVFREAHPAAVLHDDASRGHNDPRLNRVTVKGKPLLRKTGATPACASKWGDDAIYDMVGNVDEWLDDPDGSFAGGFYARSSKIGCDWRSTAHAFRYWDYSTGVRCCADLPPVK